MGNAVEIGNETATPVALGELEAHRVALTGYCYRMLGSAFEAEDAVQETMVRAWKAADRFEGRASVKSWLYRIATNVCLDMLRSAQRRARPMDLGGTYSGDASGPGAPLPESTWVQPMLDDRVLPVGADPAEVAADKETVRLAFVAALQHLPPRQRAVLILREVLHWHADEVAELLGTTVASVNSALQRARATLSDHQPVGTAPTPVDDRQRALFARYVQAFESYDMDALVALLHEEATMSMPPFPLWLRGSDHIRRWFEGAGHRCRGSRVLPIEANGALAFGQYRPVRDAAGVATAWEPWGIQVVEAVDDRIVALNSFIDARLFTFFGLPERLEL